MRLARHARDGMHVVAECVGDTRCGAYPGRISARCGITRACAGRSSR